MTQKIPIENPVPRKSTSTSRHRRHHPAQHHGRSFTVSQWLRRFKISRQMSKKLTMTVIYVALALFCFLVGYYYFGPKLTNLGE